MYKRFPDLNSIPIEAENLDYFRYLNKSKVSSVEAAHLCSGFVPQMNVPFVFMNPLLSEVKEIYNLLIDAAEENRVKNLSIKNEAFYAPLVQWVEYLGKIRHPLPNVLYEIFISSPIEEEGCSMISDDDCLFELPKKKQINKEILILDAYFPKIPYRYYVYKKEIELLLKGENISIESFEKYASKVTKSKRPAGRPRKDFLDLYEKAHPELNEWFEKIRIELEKI